MLLAIQNFEIANWLFISVKYGPKASRKPSLFAIGFVARCVFLLIEIRQPTHLEAIPDLTHFSCLDYQDKINGPSYYVSKTAEATNHFYFHI